MFDSPALEVGASSVGWEGEGDGGRGTGTSSNQRDRHEVLCLCVNTHRSGGFIL